MIFIVTGYPRSGTSMFMRAVEAGGLPIYSSKSRDAMNDALGDRYYKPNAHGFYELTKGEMLSLLDSKEMRKIDGHAVKIMSLKAVVTLPVMEEGYCYAICVRDPVEIAESFRAMFNRHIRVDSYWEDMSALYTWFTNRKDTRSVSMLEYEKCLRTPSDCFLDLGWPIDVEKASSVVDPSQHRFRRDLLKV